MNSVENNKIKNSSMQSPITLNTILRWHIKYLLHYYVDVRSIFYQLFFNEEGSWQTKNKIMPDNMLKIKYNVNGVILLYGDVKFMFNQVSTDVTT